MHKRTTKGAKHTTKTQKDANWLQADTKDRFCVVSVSLRRMGGGPY